MSRIDFVSVKKPKILRTRRYSDISSDDPQLELKRESRHVNDATSDLHAHDSPVDPEQHKLAPAVVFKNVDVFDNEFCTDGKATSEHGNGELTDKTDDGLALPETDTYPNYEVFITVLSILSYIFDVGSDIYLAFVYHSDGDIWWFTLTVIFIVVPSLTITVFSFVWYMQDDHRSCTLIWLPRLVLLFLQLGPLLRFVAYFIRKV